MLVLGEKEYASQIVRDYFEDENFYRLNQLEIKSKIQMAQNKIYQQNKTFGSDLRARKQFNVDGLQVIENENDTINETLAEN